MSLINLERISSLCKQLVINLLSLICNHKVVIDGIRSPLQHFAKRQVLKMKQKSRLAIWCNTSYILFPLWTFRGLMYCIAIQHALVCLIHFHNSCSMYYLEKVVERESVIMRKSFVVTEELLTIHVYIQINIDTMTRRIQEKYGKKLERPLFASCDGNCLFNAMSVALCGSQKLASECKDSCRDGSKCRQVQSL